MLADVFSALNKYSSVADGVVSPLKAVTSLVPQPDNDEPALSGAAKFSELYPLLSCEPDNTIKDGLFGNGKETYKESSDSNYRFLPQSKRVAQYLESFTGVLQLCCARSHAFI